MMIRMLCCVCLVNQPNPTVLVRIFRRQNGPRAVGCLHVGITAAHLIVPGMCISATCAVREVPQTLFDISQPPADSALAHQADEDDYDAPTMQQRVSSYRDISSERLDAQHEDEAPHPLDAARVTSNDPKPAHLTSRRTHVSPTRGCGAVASQGHQQAQPKEDR